MLGKNSGPGLGPPKAGRGKGTPTRKQPKTVGPPMARVVSQERNVVHPKLKKNTKRGYLKGRGTF